jgi:hypothetical protein
MKNNLEYIYLTNTTRITLISVLGTIFLSLIPFFVFVDIWSNDNAGRSDIVARGPFLAGIFIIQSLLIAVVLCAIINYIIFRKVIKFKHILLSVLANIVVSGVLILSGLAFLPGKLLDNILPYGHYMFLALMLILLIVLIKKYKNCAQQQA